MKYAPSPRGGSAIILGIAFLGLNCLAFADNDDDKDSSSANSEAIPRGTLNVDNDQVGIGGRSQLDWKIQYPKTVTDIVTVTPSTITAKETLKMRVRVLGSGLKKKGNTVNNSAGDGPIEVVWRKNNSDWALIFSGTGGTVIPTQVVLDTEVAQSDTIDFGARGYLNNKGLPLYATSTKTQNLVILKNGDETPPQIRGKTINQIGGFLKPYLSTDAKTVRIGPSELLILVDLDQTQPEAVGFDYQDLGLLVTFE